MGGSLQARSIPCGNDETGTLDGKGAGSGQADAGTGTSNDDDTIGESLHWYSTGNKADNINNL